MTGSSVSASYALGMQAVLASGARLSAPAAIFLETALDIGERAAGHAVETLAPAALAALPATFADAVGGVVGELVGAVPAIGTFVGFMADLVSLPAQQEAAEKAERAAQCQQEFRDRQVRPSGSTLGGCESCPADLFARRIPWAKGEYRPLVGEALICVTEGTAFDLAPDDVCARARGKCDLEFWRRYSAAQYSWISRHRGFVVGLDRRRHFEAVRRAIEAAWRPPPTPGASAPPSDGGLALWPSYLDLLVRERDYFKMSRKYLDWQIAASPIKLDSAGLPVELTLKSTSAECYLPALPDAIEGIIKGWRDTAIQPRYADGIQALAELDAYRKLQRRKGPGLAVRRKALLATGNAAIFAFRRGPLRSGMPRWPWIAGLGAGFFGLAGAAWLAWKRREATRKTRGGEETI